VDYRQHLCAGGNRPEATECDLSLHVMLQVLSVTPFEKIPLFQLFSDTDEDPNMVLVHLGILDPKRRAGTLKTDRPRITNASFQAIFRR
jgi:hypothetical protein